MKKRKMSSGASFIKALAFGCIIGLTVWAILVLCASYVISGRDDPLGFILPSVFILAAAAAFSAGFFMSKMFKDSPLICGIASGGILLLLVFIISTAVSGGSGMESPMLKALLCCDFMAFSLAGAKMGMPKRVPARRKKRDFVKKL